MQLGNPAHSTLPKYRWEQFLRQKEEMTLQPVDRGARTGRATCSLQIQVSYIRSALQVQLQQHQPERYVELECGTIELHCVKKPGTRESVNRFS
jgi:hypothetical protein